MAGIGFSRRRRRHSGDSGDVGQTEDTPLLSAKTPVPTRQADTARPPIMPGQVDLVFEPKSLTMALVNARLVYRLSLTNLADAAIGPVTIACDIISAHASLSPGEQLLFGGETVEPQHQFRSLVAGETISLMGELQIPMTAILPVRSGDASLFVPLARFHITALDAGRAPLISTRIFVIGERPEQPGELLGPIRIDLGQRTFSHISQREIVASA